MNSPPEQGNDAFERHALIELSRVFNASLDAHFILDHLMLVLMGRHLFSRALVFVHDYQGEMLLRSKGLRGFDVDKISDLNIGQLDKPMRIEENSTGDVKRFATAHKLRYFFPLFLKQRHYGGVFFSARSDKRELDQHSSHFIEAVCNLAASALDNSATYNRIKQLNGELDERVMKLKSLFDISKQFMAAFDEEKIAKLLGYALMGQMLISRFFIFFRQGDSWQLLNARGVSQTRAKTLFEKTNVSLLKGLTHTDSIPELRAYSLDLKISYLSPLEMQGRMRGSRGLGASLKHKGRQNGDEVFLSTLANYTITALENAWLFRQELQRQRLEEEMRLARNIQQDLLPGEIPTIPGYDLFAFNRPSYQVGGDLFDIIQLSDGKYLFAIADVTGKGTPAALLMSNIQAGLRVSASANMDLTKTAAKINRLICSNTSADKFITCFLSILDPENSTLTYVNAGHNPPYWKRHGHRQLKTLDAGGLLFGIIAESAYESETIQLAPGDTIFQFTDGINEAMNPAGEEFGELRLEEYLSTSTSSARDFVDMLLTELDTFRQTAPQSDDITLIYLRKEH
jgi:sigma-B regulation protein RsbU (phosphoserine phosphatase)